MIRLASFGFAGHLLLLLCGLTTSIGMEQSQINDFANALSVYSDESLGVGLVQESLENVTVVNKTLSGFTILGEIKTSIETKIGAAVDALESNKNLLLEHYKTAVTNPSLPDFTSRQCCEVQESNTFWDERFLAQVDPDDFCLRFPAGSASSNRDEDVAALDALDAAFVSNLADNPSLKWQYYGTSSGSFGIYPAKGRDSCSDYDARFRPWYAATTTPKMVVVLMDSSGSMSLNNRINIAKAAVSAVLSTLNEDDMIALIDFDAVARRIETNDEYDSCLGSQLAPATTQNVARMQSFLDSIEDSGGTNFNDAYEAAYDYIENTLDARPDLRDTASVILFLTDGEAASPATLINTRQNDLDAKGYRKPISLVFGIGAVDTSVLSNVASITGGSFSNLPNTDITVLTEAMGSYYTNPIFTPEDKNVTLTTPYFDGITSGLGIVTTIAAQVRDETQTLKGVVGIDLSLYDLLEDVRNTFANSQFSYAFLTDPSGRVFSHPNLPNPNDYLVDPLYVDIASLEWIRDGDFETDVRASMLAGDTSSFLLSDGILRFTARGAEHEGTEEVLVTGAYYWAPINVTGSAGLRLGVFIADSEITSIEVNRAIPEYEAPETPDLYHRVDLYDAGYETCNNLNNVASKETSSIYFAPQSFESPNAYIITEETATLSSSISDLWLGSELYAEDAATTISNAESAPGQPPVEILGSNVKVEALSDARLTAPVEELWLSRSSYTENIIWKYCGTQHGVFRSFPAHASIKGYDPTIRPWYLRSLYNVGKICVSPPYEDASGAGTVMTLSKTITVIDEGQEVVLGVCGMDFFVETLQELLVETVPDCEESSISCYVIDASGYVILGPSTSDLGNYFGDVSDSRGNGLIYSMIQEGLASIATCNDYEGEERLSHLQLDELAIGTQKSFPTCQSTSEESTIYSVPGTNLYLLQVSGLTCSNPCASVASCGEFCRCDEELPAFVCNNTFDLPDVDASDIGTTPGLATCVPPPPENRLYVDPNAVSVPFPDAACFTFDFFVIPETADNTVPILIGTLAAVLILVAAVLYVRRRNRKKKGASGVTSQDTPGPAPPTTISAQPAESLSEIPVAEVVHDSEQAASAKV